jgi:hypothetical protein
MRRVLLLVVVLLLAGMILTLWAGLSGRIRSRHGVGLRSLPGVATQASEVRAMAAEEMAGVAAARERRRVHGRLSHWAHHRQKS